MTALERLFDEWLGARHSMIWEYSVSIGRDEADLLTQAQDFARELGIDLANREPYRDLRYRVIEQAKMEKE